jgi:Zn-dependent M28 family amino/carboxypeptidase
MKMKKTLVLVFAFASGILLQAQSVNDEELFRNSIRTLASDEFGGRKPLSPHESKTIRYIADEFKALGLVPANGDSYFQPVPLLNVETQIRKNAIVVNGKKGSVTLHPMTDYILWSQRSGKNPKPDKADYVFVGFGIHAPEFGWDDYAGVDVKGKIVVMLVNDPGFYDDHLFHGKNMTYYGRWTYKFEEANRQGAAGAFVIHEKEPASYDWNVVQNSWAGKNLGLYSENENLIFKGWITNDAAKQLFGNAGLSYNESVAAAQKKGFKSFALGLNSRIEVINNARIEDSHNVAGIFEGTDLKDEYIIYSAHWDHLGVGLPVDNDSIYNGAADNASGIAALFVIANRFKQLGIRPRRSILFLAVTGEESGLLGSEYYARHPLFPLEKTVVNLNMDGYAPKSRSHDVILGGSGDAETDKYVIEAAATQGRVVKPAANQTTGAYYRSDHFSFAKAGLPVILAVGGGDFIDPEAVEARKAKYGDVHTYHQPNDEYHEWWDVAGSLDDIYLYFGIGLRLANDSYFPKWNEGVVYKNIREGRTK